MVLTLEGYGTSIVLVLQSKILYYICINYLTIKVYKTLSLQFEKFHVKIAKGGWNFYSH